MTSKFAPIADDAQATYSTRQEAESALYDMICGDYAGDIAAEFDLEAIADELIEWHTCYVERNGELVVSHAVEAGE